MDKIEYNFSGFIDAIDEIVKSSISPDASKNTAALISLKNELNKFFKDSECKEVIMTCNLDKPLFGLKVLPLIDADDVYDYIVDDDKVRIEKYIVEIDSKLFTHIGAEQKNWNNLSDTYTGISDEEFLAILIRDVSHLVGTSEPMEIAKHALNAYFADNGTHLKISESIHYKEILAYGLKDYISKEVSTFYLADRSSILSDDMLVSYCIAGWADKTLADFADAAYEKIYNNNIKLYENVSTSKFIVFGWTLDLYRNIRTRRVSAIKTLEEAKILTASRLEQMEMENVIRRIRRIDDDTVLTESVHTKIKEKLRKARLNNLKTIDSTFYELSMQVKNIEDENDALYLMRQINNSLAIIDEYRNSDDCDEYEAEKCDQLMKRFSQLRDKLSSTVVYKNKTYIPYPDNFHRILLFQDHMLL